ncbi:hypothetical protein BDV96DRAFT_601203 [Lophiotrema nucula]|uniref:Uncharacterized protein n=1 Tax=Lophiotrema nucula TaxID=690887 RepID=A0A6A5Z3T1_9PLEO|nr:hypothetical protein BDV96DRAFT_601203 [Lophiotrema nucula]
MSYMKQDLSLSAERGIKYRGTASIRIECLTFPSEASRPLDTNNVERLVELFRKSGCCHHKISHHVPAIIDDASFNAALSASNTSKEALKVEPSDALRNNLTLVNFTARFANTWVTLEIPALSGGMRLSTLHKTFAMKCEEEVLYYLGYIRKIWYQGIFDGDQRLIFSEESRKVLWDRILMVSADSLILSLFTFFEDANFLEVVVPSIKMLVEIPPGKDSEKNFKSRAGTDADQIDIGYRQIWISAMRHYEHMPNQPKKPAGLLAKSTYLRNVKVTHDFAALAYKLGFRSSRVLTLKESSADREIARNALLEARPLSHYTYRDFETLVGTLAALFDHAEAADRMHVDESGESGKAPKRCGIPNARDHAKEKTLLFVEQFHKALDEHESELSPFFIRRSVYFAFFGRPHQRVEHLTSEPSTGGSGSSGQTTDEGMSDHSDNDRDDETSAASRNNRDQQSQIGSQSPKQTENDEINSRYDGEQDDEASTAARNNSEQQNLQHETDQLKSVIESLEQEKRGWIHQSTQLERERRDIEQQQSSQAEVTGQGTQVQEAEDATDNYSTSHTSSNGQYSEEVGNTTSLTIEVATTSGKGKQALQTLDQALEEPQRGVEASGSITSSSLTMLSGEGHVSSETAIVPFSAAPATAREDQEAPSRSQVPEEDPRPIRYPLESTEVAIFAWSDGKFAFETIQRVQRDLAWDMTRFTVKYGRKLTSYQPFDYNGRMLNARTCWNDVIEDGSNRIFLAPPEVMKDTMVIDSIAAITDRPERGTNEEQNEDSSSPQKRTRHERPIPQPANPKSSGSSSRGGTDPARGRK